MTVRLAMNPKSILLCVLMAMAAYPEKRRMLDVLEPGVDLELRDIGGSKLFGKVLRMLSDGGLRKAIVACQNEEGTFSVRQNATVDVFFGKMAAGRKSLYSFETILLEASLNGANRVVVISLPENVTRREHRTSFRIMISIGGKFFHGDGVEGSDAVPFMTQDISAGGMRIVSATPLETGSIGAVELDIPEAGLPRLMAEVVRSGEGEDGRYIGSLRFINVKPREEDILYGLIRDWERGFNAFKKKRFRFR